jgi:hypothetical protein
LSNLAILSALYDNDERTRERTDIAVAAAEACRKPLAAAYAYGCAAIARMLLGDTTATRRLAQTAERAASKHGLVYWAAMARILGGWADARSGNPSLGLASLKDGLSLYSKTEALVLRPLALIMLADAEAESKLVDRALEALDEADVISERIGTCAFKCLILAARGRVLKISGDEARAAQAYTDATAEANAVGASAVASRALAALDTVCKN